MESAPSAPPDPPLPPAPGAAPGASTLDDLDTNTPPPLPRLPSQSWIWGKRLLIAAYLLGASLLCAVLVIHVPKPGTSMRALLPNDAEIFIHIQDFKGNWDDIKNHPAFQALLNQPDTGPLLRKALEKGDLGQLLLEDLGGGTSEALLEKRRKAEAPAFLVPRTLQGLLTNFDGEIALAVWPSKRSTANQENPPPQMLLLFRVQGWRGAVLRAFLPLIHRKMQRDRHPFQFYDFGGDLLGVASEGTPWRDSSKPLAPEELPAPETIAEMAYRPAPRPPDPKAIWAHLLGYYDVVDWMQAFGLPRRGFDLQLNFRTDGAGGLIGEGTWKGTLPPSRAPAPLLTGSLEEKPEAFFEAILPFQAGDFFDLWVAKDCKTRKGKRAWIGDMAREGRFLKLSRNGVDLDEMLWPACGSPFCVKLYPPDANATVGLPQALASLPFESSAQSEYAFNQLLGVCTRGYIPNPKKGQERPYVRPFERGNQTLYALLRKDPPVPLWLFGENHWSFILDSGIQPQIFKPVLEPVPQEKGSWPIFYVRSNGARLAKHAKFFPMLLPDDGDDETTAMELLEQQGDTEEKVSRQLEAFTRFSGEVLFEVRPNRKIGEPATVYFHWTPQAP